MEKYVLQPYGQWIEATREEQVPKVGDKLYMFVCDEWLNVVVEEIEEGKDIVYVNTLKTEHTKYFGCYSFGEIMLEAFVKIDYEAEIAIRALQLMEKPR